MAGRSGATTVRLLGYPVLGCPRGHERREAYPDFNPELIDALFDRDHLPFASSRGLFPRRRECSRCDRSLEDVEPARSTVSGRVLTRGHDDIAVEITGPALPCPGCGLVQLPDSRDRASEITDAMVDALEKEGISPA